MMNHNQYKYDELEDIVYNKLCQFFAPRYIQRDVRLMSLRGDIDILVGNETTRLLAIEVKGTRFITTEVFSHIKENYQRSNAYCIILTDGENCIIAQRIQNQIYNDSEEQLFQEFLTINKEYLVGLLSLDTDNIIYNVKNAINGVTQSQGMSRDKVYIDKVQQLRTFFDTIQLQRQQNATILLQQKATFVLSEDKEREFFYILLGAKEYSYIAKFSGERSLYSLLDYHTQNMCSLVCMNDPQEVGYVENYPHDKGIDLRADTNDEANNTFILSACEDGTEKDLTMWRLYGGDAKGICTKYKVNNSKLNQNGFYLAPVSYAIEKGFHFELEIVYALAKCGLAFKNWYIWKHFFKSYDYSIEHEIRLLYLPNENNVKNVDGSIWFTDDRTKIHSEMKLFKLDGNDEHRAFPLSIEQILLGNLFPNAGKNVKQFNLRFKNTNIYTPHDRESVFELSQITNYR